MNKKNLFPLSILLVSSLSAFAADAIKVGYYNAELAIAKSEFGKNVTSEIEKKRQGFASELTKLQAEYQKKVENYQAKKSTMSVVAREEVEKELMRERREIENKSKGYEDDFQVELRQMQNRAFAEVSKAALEWGKEGGYDMMRAVVQGPDVIINSEKIDAATAGVSQIMDRNNTKKATAAS